MLKWKSDMDKMMKELENVTRASLAQALYERIGFSLTDSGRLVDEVFDEISNAFLRGEEVKLTSFATFKIKEKTKRIGRNPKTKEEYPISARKVLTFHPSLNLKNAVNAEDKE